MTDIDALINRIVDRFLQWKLPEAFRAVKDLDRAIAEARAKHRPVKRLLDAKRERAHQMLRGDA